MSETSSLISQQNFSPLLSKRQSTSCAGKARATGGGTRAGTRSTWTRRPPASCDRELSSRDRALQATGSEAGLRVWERLGYFSEPQPVRSRTAECRGGGAQDARGRPFSGQLCGSSRPHCPMSASAARGSCSWTARRAGGGRPPRAATVRSPGVPGQLQGSRAGQHGVHRRAPVTFPPDAAEAPTQRDGARVKSAVPGARARCPGGPPGKASAAGYTRFSGAPGAQPALGVEKADQVPAEGRGGRGGQSGAVRAAPPTPAGWAGADPGRRGGGGARSRGPVPRSPQRAGSPGPGPAVRCTRRPAARVRPGRPSTRRAGRPAPRPLPAAPPAPGPRAPRPARRRTKPAARTGALTWPPPPSAPAPAAEGGAGPRGAGRGGAAPRPQRVVLAPAAPRADWPSAGAGPPVQTAGGAWRAVPARPRWPLGPAPWPPRPLPLPGLRARLQRACAGSGGGAWRERIGKRGGSAGASEPCAGGRRWRGRKEGEGRGM